MPKPPPPVLGSVQPTAAKSGGVPKPGGAARPDAAANKAMPAGILGPVQSLGTSLTRPPPTNGPDHATARTTRGIYPMRGDRSEVEAFMRSAGYKLRGGEVFVKSGRISYMVTNELAQERTTRSRTEKTNLST